MRKLSEIYIYPIKSLGGISLTNAKVTPLGLMYDRRWVLIDSQNNCITQRTNPDLALFQPNIIDKKMAVSIKNKPEIQINFGLNEMNLLSKMNINVWEDEVTVFEVNSTVSTWFSKQLGFEVKLVYQPESSIRKVNSKYSINNQSVTSLSDGFPYLIIGQASLDDLNSRLNERLNINRFRPNLVYTGGLAYEEETWNQFQVGQVKFMGVKPCERCIMTTVSQESGKIQSKEPLKTLSKYKVIDNKITFGQNVIAPVQGFINIGDFVEVDSNL
jgi:uncharacterized protein